MMRTKEKKFRVVAVANPGGSALTLRQFEDQEAAIQYALGVNMATWDDVRVEPITGKPEEVTPPPMPWRAKWDGAICNIVDANGQKILTIYGSVNRKADMVKLIEERFGA